MGSRLEGGSHAAPETMDDCSQRASDGHRRIWRSRRGSGGSSALLQENGDRVVLPLNAQVHHALRDGVHVGRLFENVEGLMKLADEANRD